MLTAVLFVVLMCLAVVGVAAAAMAAVLFLGVADDVRLLPRRPRTRAVDGP